MSINSNMSDDVIASPAKITRLSALSVEAFDNYLSIREDLWRVQLEHLERFKQQRFFDQLRHVVASAETSPEFFAQIHRLLLLDSSDSASLRNFIRDHLAHIPAFRELLLAAQGQFSEQYAEIIRIIRSFSGCMWRKIVASFALVETDTKCCNSVFSFECHKAQLWPLLMAFKNP
jgi:hypothetical protein